MDLKSAREQWHSLGYSRGSELNHHLEFGVMEALLYDSSIQLRYISTSGSEYPILPETNDSEEMEIINAGLEARQIVSRFSIAPRASGMGYRTYCGTIADSFEAFLDSNKYLASKVDPTHFLGCIAADRFLELHIRNRAYDEDPYY